MSKRATRIRDLELAVGSLACIIERMVSGKWSKDERADMLLAAGRARMLVDCEHMPSVGAGEYIAREQEREEAETERIISGIEEGAGAVARAAGVKEKIEPQKYNGERFFIDLPSGDAYATESPVEAKRMFATGQALNIYDRLARVHVVWQGSLADNTYGKAFEEIRL